MYNQELATHILKKLKEFFPRKVHLFELRREQSEFSSLPESDWITAAEALVLLGHANAKVLRAGQPGVAKSVANIEITAQGRAHLDSNPIEVGDSGQMDVSLPILSRRQFDTDLATYLSSASSTAPLSLVYIDFDKFKGINDRFGHGVGDELLLLVASAMKSACSGKGRCYRWGGDEFAVLLPNYHAHESQALAERIRSSVRASASPQYPDVTLSVGISDYPGTSSSVSKLFKDADAALYEAKNLGGDRVCVASTGSAETTSQPQRPAKVDVKARIERVRFWIKLIKGLAPNFLINIENHSNEEILVEEIILESAGVQLTEPACAPREGIWKVLPQASLPIGWFCKTNPAITLGRMHDEGLFFRTEIDFVVGTRILGEFKEFRQKTPVKVNASNQEIVPVI